jgi:IMP dehydrogenase
MKLPFNLFKRKPKYAAKPVSKINQLNQAITFDDVLLEPQYSEVETRKNVDISTSLLGFKLLNPLISANMDTVTEANMAIAMNNLGGIGILHRYQDIQAIVDQAKLIKQNGGIVIASIGVGSEAVNLGSWLIANKTADGLCIDIAHGDSKLMIETITAIKKDFPTAKIIAGNVATYEGGKRLLEAGADALKVGIGPGAVCTTRRVTGHGVPQITAIAEVAELKKDFKFDLIADGGIRDSGDIAKALAFGADTVMIGSLFATTTEAPGTIMQGQKIYRGMASREARSDFDPELPTDYTPEGVAIMKPMTGPVSLVVNNLNGGLKSALSYSGSNNLTEFRQKVRFMLITGASHIEGTPHGMSTK